MSFTFGSPGIKGDDYFTRYVSVTEIANARIAASATIRTNAPRDRRSIHGVRLKSSTRTFSFGLGSPHLIRLNLQTFFAMTLKL